MNNFENIEGLAYHTVWSGFSVEPQTVQQNHPGIKHLVCLPLGLTQDRVFNQQTLGDHLIDTGICILLNNY